MAALVAVLAAVPCAAAGQEPTAPAEPQAPDDTRPPLTTTIQPRRLDLTMSLFDAYDRTEATIDIAPDPLIQQSASFTGVNAGLGFSQSGKGHSFSAGGGTGLRYYSTAPTLLPINYYGGLNFAASLGRRLQVRGSENASLSPFYTFGSTLGSNDLNQIIAPSLDQGVVRVDTRSSDSSAGLTWTLGRRASLSAGYTFTYVEAGDTAYRVRTQGANGAYQYQKTRYLNLRLGYGYYRSELASGTGYFSAHNIDTGIGYRRPLSFSRRSVVGFNVGSTMFTDGASRSFYVTGDASLSHQLSRRWSATLSYNRGVGKVGGQASPYVTDSIGGGVAGVVTPHLSLSGSGGYARGNTASGSQNAYHSMYASGRVNYALTRFLPIYGEYVYYGYEFNLPIGLARGLPLLVSRNGLRTGLSYALPLIGRRPARQ